MPTDMATIEMGIRAAGNGISLAEEKLLEAWSSKDLLPSAFTPIGAKPTAGQFALLPTGGVTDPKKHKAAGGPVQAGVRYKTGERGEEVFTPSENGYITPNSRLGQLGGGGQGGGQTINLTVQQVDVHGVQDAAAFFDQLRTIALDRAGSGATPSLWN